MISIVAVLDYENKGASRGERGHQPYGIAHAWKDSFLVFEEAKFVSLSRRVQRS
jgi:hypothetical protein